MKKEIKAVVQKIRAEGKFYRAVMADPRCPRSSKWLIGAALAYAVTPIDFIPDFIPVIGHLDDLIVVPLLISIALRKIPREVIQENRQKQLNPTD